MISLMKFEPKNVLLKNDGVLNFLVCFTYFDKATVKKFSQ